MRNSRLVDFHCHLDLYPNFRDIIDECEAREVYTLAVTTTPRAWYKNKEYTQDKKFVRAALGLHPQLVKDYHHELDLMYDLIANTKYIGEIGIDGSKNFKDSFELQSDVFDSILQRCSKCGGNKILSIHSRAAASRVISVIEKNQDAGKFVLHWFSDSMYNLELAISLGCWFSIGPTMFRSKKSLELIKRMPYDKIITETDGPFTTNSDNISLMPWDSLSAIEHLAMMWGKDLELTKLQVLDNFQLLLR